MSLSSPALSTIHVRGASVDSDDSDGDTSSSGSEQYHKTVRARIQGEGLLIIAGLDSITNTAELSPAPTLPPATIGGETWRDGAESVASSQDQSAVDEPNERGLYSKAYVLRHPEMTWTHRGQGRYLPTSDLLGTKSGGSRRKRSADDDSIDDQHSARSTKRRRSSHALFVDHARESKSPTQFRSPSSTHNADASATYGLRRRRLEQEPTATASELREARMLRRMAQIEQMPVVQESHDDYDQDPDRTYSKPYVEAHPDLKFKHCGRGFYRRQWSQSSSSQSSPNSRRGSNQSLERSDHDAPSELKGFSGDDSRPSENGYHRRASAVSQPTTTSSNTAGSDDSMELKPTDSFSKEQMLGYKERYPDTVFVHRGNGRYKRVDDVQAKADQASHVEDHVTYSRSYVDAHPELDFYHSGAGRYKRGSRPSHLPKQNGTAARSASARLEEKTSLDDSHVQGRRALTRREISNASSESTAKHDKEALFDREYVDQHPEETFHHRGQGRWARGLPPPGSSSKMAVRGPGIKLVRSPSNTNGAPRGEKQPDPLALLRKEDGPAKWPDLTWNYRGGGKWSLSKKEKVMKPLSQSNEHAEPHTDTEAQSDVDSSASMSRRASLTSLDPALPTFRRRRSAFKSADVDDGLEAQTPGRSRSASPSQQVLALEEDTLTDTDLPAVYLDRWPQLGPYDTDDEAAKVIRSKFRPLNDPDLFLRSMTKHDPAIRPTETLYRLAEHMQDALRLMQDEYLELDKITAPHARIPRKLATGGRLPLDQITFEDRKEAELYSYTFDPKKIGFQDPVAQRVISEVDSRGLRKRRKRNEVDNEAGTQHSDVSLARRVPKPVQKFDGNPAPQSRRPRSTIGTRGSATPDPAVTPEKRAGQDYQDNYVAPRSGRWANHIPKRIRELRGHSAGPGKPTDGGADGESSVGVDGDDESTDGDTPRKRGPQMSFGPSIEIQRVVSSIEEAEGTMAAHDTAEQRRLLL